MSRDWGAPSIGGIGKAALGLLIVLAAGSACRSKRAHLARGDGAAVVVVPAPEPSQIGEDSPATLGESEPNSTLERAQVLQVGLGTQSESSAGSQALLAGILDPLSDVDMFRLSLAMPQGPQVDAEARSTSEASTSVRVELVALARALKDAQTNANDSLQMQVMAADGQTNLLKASVSERGLVVPNLPLSVAKDLIIRLSRPKAKGVAAVPYSLRAEVRRTSAGEEIEPNSATAEATNVSPTTGTAEMAGYLGWTADTDWFAVRFPSNLTHTTLNLELQLPDAASAQVAFGDATGVIQHGYTRGSSGTLSLSHVIPPPDGVAWIRVQNAGMPVASGRYRLAVFVVPSEPGWEREPNDVTAQPFGDSASMRGQLHPPGDTDLFAACDAMDTSFQILPSGRSVLNVSVLAPDKRLIFQQDIEAAGPIRVPASPAGKCNIVQIREKAGRGSSSLAGYQVQRAP